MTFYPRWYAVGVAMVLGGLFFGSTGHGQQFDRSALRERLLDRFDEDGDGRLSANERQSLREAVRAGAFGSRGASVTKKEGVGDLYKVEWGPHAIGVHETLVLRDDARDKDLALRITYPKVDGSVPVIVWSHGATGTKDNYRPLVQHWASHGYACIQANHSDSFALTGKLGGQLGNEVFRDWASRPQDVALILDSLDAIEAGVEMEPVRLDRHRIGVGGHSFGAHTAQLVAGTTTKRLAGEQVSHADGRPKAFVLISPQGRGMLLDETSWDGVTRPALIVTGSNDQGRNGEPAEWRLDPFRFGPPDDKYLLFIEGAHHGFGGIAGLVSYRNAGGENPNHLAYVQSVTTAFWDAYLKTDDEAAAFLRSDQLEGLSEGEARLEQRTRSE